MTFVEKKHLAGPSVKALLRPLKKTAGRSRSGRITVRHRGGGSKRKYRIIDFQKKLIGLKAKILKLEYDPNRTAWIALAETEDKRKFYTLAPHGLKEGDDIQTVASGEPRVGLRMPLKSIPVGTMIHNIEIKPGQGGKLVRAAGTWAQVLAHEGKYANIKLPSGEVRKILKECLADIGQLSNVQHRFENLGKAGRARWKGQRPEVRGSAMNPVDHPHGGGEGRTGIGLKHPKTKWGKPAYGVKTRRKNKASSRLILKRRKKKKRK